MNILRSACLLLFLSFLFPVSLACSQPLAPSCTRQPHGKFVVRDTIRYVVSYSYSTYRDTDHPEQRDVDEVWLEIGDTVTKQYSRPRWVNDSLVDVFLANGPRPYRPLHQWCMREEIFCGIITDTILWCYQDVLFEKSYAWFETWPTQAWEMVDGKKEIIGYSCRKATVDFRGRHYTAWYAPDIPLPYGPWSFHGLPGLILEIKDDTDRVSFVANWFSKVHEKRTLRQYAGFYVKTTRKKVRKLIELMHKHPYIYAGDWADHISISGGGWGPKFEWKHTWVELE